MEDPDAILADLADAIEGDPKGFFDLVPKTGDGPVYYLSDAGVLVRLTPGPGAGRGNVRAFHLEIFDPEGKRLSVLTKRGESMSLFSLKLSRELVHSAFFKLKRRPNVLPAPNFKTFGEIASSSVFGLAL